MHIRHIQQGHGREAGYDAQLGFTLVEMLVAAIVFMLLATSITSLYASALKLQRRATALVHIEENAQFLTESISRQLRVGTVVGDTSCASGPQPGNSSITINYPDPVSGANVAATYAYNSGTGVVTLNGTQITTGEVQFTKLAFCVSGSATDGKQTEVTIPMTIQSTSVIPAVSVTLQTTIASRDMLIR